MMPVTELSVRELIDAVARRVIEHTDQLTALDAAIGDGDHGINMKRGLEGELAVIHTSRDLADQDASGGAESHGPHPGHEDRSRLGSAVWTPLDDARPRAAGCAR